MKEAFMTLALKLGLEEWEEFEHMEVSKKSHWGNSQSKMQGREEPWYKEEWEVWPGQEHMEWREGKERMLDKES